jgi:hypothetical protein
MIKVSRTIGVPHVVIHHHRHARGLSMKLYDLVKE